MKQSATRAAGDPTGELAAPLPPALSAATVDGPINVPAFTAKIRMVRHRRLAAVLVLATAFVGLLSAVTPPLRGRLHAVLDFLPVELPQAAATTLVFTSLGLVLLARGLRRGHRLAWFAALALLAFSAALHLLKGGDVEEAALVVLVAGWLVFRRADFPVRTARRTVRRRVAFVGFLWIVALGVSVALVIVVGARRRSDIDASVLAFLRPALGAAGIALVAAAAWFGFGPHDPAHVSAGRRRFDRRRARQIIERWGGDTLTYFALRSDKDYFFWGGGVVAYRVRKGVCLVSPDPIGPVHEWTRLWAEFATFADANGWAVAVLGAHEGWLPVYRAAGMQPVYMGDEAIVDCRSFTFEGRAVKPLRNCYNRVQRAGYRVRFYNPTEVGPELQQELRALMTESRRGSSERGFSMTLSRIFHPEDTELLLSVAFDGDGAAAAMCQWVPANDINGWSLDVMRRRADAKPNGVTDFLVMETIMHVRDAGGCGVALNFAVMREIVAGERNGGLYTLQRRVLQRFSETMQIESLWKYNAKYHPYWRPRYVVLDGAEHGAAVGVAIADAESFGELPLLGRFVGRSA